MPPLDRSRIEYLIDDLRSRPERVRLLAQIGIVVGVLLALGVVLLLTLGGPSRRPKLKVTPAQRDVTISAAVQDAFEFAKTAQSIVEKDMRFSRVYFVPTAATATQKHGKIVVMGEVATDADLQALQAQLAGVGVPVPVEWQVVVGDASVPFGR